MATTPLYINKALLSDGDTIVPVLFSCDDPISSDILADSLTNREFSTDCTGYHTAQNITLLPDNSVAALSSYWYYSGSELHVGNFDPGCNCGEIGYNTKEIIGLSRGAGGGYSDSSYSYSPVILLKHDGSVVLLQDSFLQNKTKTNLSLFRGWNDIVDCFAVRLRDKESYTIAGLKADGRLVLPTAAETSYVNMQPGWSELTNVVMVSGAFALHTDGTVPRLGWSSIKHITSFQFDNGSFAVVGVKIDGTVCRTSNVPADVDTWTDISEVILPPQCTGVIGIKNNGTVVYCGGVYVNGNPSRTAADLTKLNNWTDIKAIHIDSSAHFIIGVKNSGTIVHIVIEDPGTGLMLALSDTDSWTAIKMLAYVSIYSIIGVMNDGTCCGTGSQINKTQIAKLTDISIMKYICNCFCIIKKSGVFTQAELTVLTGDGTGSYYGIGFIKDGVTQPWKDITQINTNSGNIIGLKADGTVNAIYYNSYYAVTPDTPVTSWSNITKVAASRHAFFGLTSSGTVLSCTFYRSEGDSVYNTSSLTNVIDIVAGGAFLAVLKSDHTVTLVPLPAYMSNTGYKYPDAVNLVASWTDVVKIVAGYDTILAIKTDGTGIACKCNTATLVDLTNFTNIIKWTFSGDNLYGLRADGTWVTNAASPPALGNIKDLFCDSAVLADGSCCRLVSGNSEWKDSHYKAVGYGADWLLSSGLSNPPIHSVDHGWTYTLTTPTSMIDRCFDTTGTDASNVIGVLRKDKTCELYSTKSLAGWNTWSDLVDLLLCPSRAYGITSAGAVLYTGPTSYGRDALASWTGIISVADSGQVTVGLKADGTCVCTNYNAAVVAAVATWTDITQVVGSSDSSSYNLFVGLKKNGTLVVANPNGVALRPYNGNDFVKLSRGYNGIFAHRFDGTVVFIGDPNSYGYTAFSPDDGWIKISKIVTYGNCVLGIRSDGKVVCAGPNTGNKLTNISSLGNVVDACLFYDSALYKLGDGSVTYRGASASVNFPPNLTTYDVAPLHFQYSNGAEIPFKHARRRRPGTNTYDLFVELQINKALLGTGRSINIIHGDTTQKLSKGCTALTGKKLSKYNISKEYLALVTSYSDVFYGRDIILRLKDGSLIKGDFSKTVSFSGGAITSVDIILSVLAQKSEDICVCYGAPPGDELSVPANMLTGVTPTEAANNPTPGVFWDYTPPAVYEVFGSDGLKYSDLPIRSFDYTVSDGLKSGETQAVDQTLAGVVRKLQIKDAIPSDGVVQFKLRINTDNEYSTTILNGSVDK